METAPSLAIYIYFYHSTPMFYFRQKMSSVFALNYNVFFSWLQKAPMHAFRLLKVIVCGNKTMVTHFFKPPLWGMRCIFSNHPTNKSSTIHVGKYTIFPLIRCWGTKFCLKQSAISGGTTLIAADCSSFTLHLGLMLLRLPGHPLNAIVSPKK